MISGDMNVHVIAYDYGFCDLEDSKYDEFTVSGTEMWAKIANTENHISMLVKYDEALLVRP